MSERIWARRAAILLAVSAVAGCSQSGPDHAEALAQISSRLRASFAAGEKRLENLEFMSGEDLGGDRYAVFVQYDLVSILPEIGLFNTNLKPGDRSHVSAERYVFVRSNTGWLLE